MLGKKLKGLLKTSNCKQLELAKHLNISPSRLSNYLSDKREPSFDMLVEIAKFLNVDMNFFADANFSKKMGRTAALVQEKTATYTATDRENIVNIPIMPVNAKKHSMKTTTIPFSKMFLTECEDPESRFVIFEVNSAMPVDFADDGDYVLCLKCNDESDVENGDFLLENGRNTKYFRYYKHDNATLLVNEYEKSEHLTLTDPNDLKNYYKILWKISKFK